MPSSNQEKQQQLIAFIYHMAEMTYGFEDIERCFYTLREIYVDDFRHQYADFFPVIVTISNRDEGKYAPEFLIANFKTLLEYTDRKISEALEDKNLSDFRASLIKLIDHLNLEVSRRNYYSGSIEEKLEELTSLHKSLNKKLLEESTQSVELRGKLGTLQTDLNNAREELEEARKELKSSHLDVITVLGIFAAIAFSFMGGMSYLGGAFTSMSEMPVLKALLYILVAGFVLFNVIHLLLFIIGRIIEKEFKFFTWYTITVNAIIIAAVVAILAYYFYCFCCGFEVPNILHPALNLPE